ncbi:MAG: hypothetical protein JRC77_04900, partial [Deltaproteobacteria bacterium]|nr:hypothetical protein [Deltaproteobacteria bacterium]
DATEINETMKMAAVRALAELARSGEDDLPQEVRAAYPGERFNFGPEYIIPKPFDSRVFVQVSSAVAEAAMESGAARRKIDMDYYRQQLFIRAEDMRKKA